MLNFWLSVMLTVCFEVQEKLSVFRSTIVFVFPAVVKLNKILAVVFVVPS